MIEFEIFVEIGLVGCTKKETIDVPKEELKNIPEADWDEYVWMEYGGEDIAMNMIEIGIGRKK